MLGSRRERDQYNFVLLFAVSVGAAWAFWHQLTRKMPGRMTLPQALARRAQEDNVLLQSDKSAWYATDQHLLKSVAMREKFVRMNADAETMSFVRRSVEKSDWLFTQVWHNLAKTVLSLFYTKTDINGILERGSMFVLSEEQLLRLADKAGIQLSKNAPEEAMIDLGAGDGCPTGPLLPYFRTFFATEASSAMRRILTRKGFQVLDIDTWHLNRSFDLVSCLNLLDRCDRPVDVLDQTLSALKPGGLFLAAVVLPFSPYVEFSEDKRPSQKLMIAGKGFERQAENLADIMEERGFELLSWTRVPYMCEGDLAKSVYVLDDAVFLMRKKTASGEMRTDPSKA